MSGKFIFVGIRDFKCKEKARIKNKELHKKERRQKDDKSREKYESRIRDGANC